MGHSHIAARARWAAKPARAEADAFAIQAADLFHRRATAMAAAAAAAVSERFIRSSIRRSWISANSTSWRTMTTRASVRPRCRCSLSTARLCSQRWKSTRRKPSRSISCRTKATPCLCSSSSMLGTQIRPTRKPMKRHTSSVTGKYVNGVVQDPDNRCSSTHE